MNVRSLITLTVGCDLSNQSQLEGVLVSGGRYNSSLYGTVTLHSLSITNLFWQIGICQ